MAVAAEGASGEQLPVHEHGKFCNSCRDFWCMGESSSGVFLQLITFQGWLSRFSSASVRADFLAGKMMVVTTLMICCCVLIGLERSCCRRLSGPTWRLNS
jgi:hypothetical protein